MYGCLTDPDLVYEKAVEGEDIFEGTKSIFPAGYSTKTCQPENSGTHVLFYGVMC